MKRKLIFLILICNILSIHLALNEQVCFARSPADIKIQGFEGLQIRTQNPFEPKFPKKEIDAPVKKVEPPKPDKAKPIVPPKKTQPVKLPEDVQITPPSLKITGLVWDSIRPQAIVNNQIVDVGDSVSGAEIVSIDKTGLEIYYQGETFTITP